VKSFFLVAAGAILWGCWPLFLRSAGLSGPQSALLVFVVMSLPAPFLLRCEAWKDRKATLAVALLGLGDAANAALFFAAVQRGPVAVAVLTHYLCPLLLALAAPWVLRERRSARALLGGPLTLAGLALLLGTPQGGLVDPWTAVLGGASAFFFAVNVLASKTAARAYSPMALNALHSPISMVALLLAFGSQALPTATTPSLLWVAAGAVVCGMGGNVLFNLGLRHVPTAAAGALMYLEPLTGAVLGLLVFGETLGPQSLLGGVLVLGTGVWVASESRSQAPSPLPAPASSAQ
jgi:drug/metabolite transporter (DMT)-like permease